MVVQSTIERRVLVTSLGHIVSMETPSELACLQSLILIASTTGVTIWRMRKTTKSPGEKIIKDIKRATRKQYSSEEKIRIVLDGLRGEVRFH